MSVNRCQVLHSQFAASVIVKNLDWNIALVLFV